MNLQTLLAARVAAGKPVRVGLIGAGKFGSMFLAQVPTIEGLDVALICDRDVERAKAACNNVGWDASRVARARFSEGDGLAHPPPQRILARHFDFPTCPQRVRPGCSRRPQDAIRSSRPTRRPRSATTAAWRPKQR